MTTGRRRYDRDGGGQASETAFATATASHKEKTAMNRDELFPGKYFKHSDVEDEPFVGVIAYVEKETLNTSDGERKEKPVVYFTNSAKRLVLNVTNYTTIAESLGSDETDDWFRREIELFAATTSFGGKSLPCVRVRAPQKAQQLPRRKRQPPPKPDEDDGSPI